MNRRALYIIGETKVMLECGHTAPLLPMKNTSLVKTMQKLHSGRLYRNCGKCKSAQGKSPERL